MAVTWLLSIQAIHGCHLAVIYSGLTWLSLGCYLFRPYMAVTWLLSIQAIHGCHLAVIYSGHTWLSLGCYLFRPYMAVTWLLSIQAIQREVLTRLTGRCYCLLCAFLWIFADICLFECCVSYCCVRHGMDDILVCLLCIDATGIQSNMRVFVSTFDC